MEEKINYGRVYAKGNKEFVPYSMSPNFSNGTRICPHCKNTMERIPNHHGFKRVQNGKVLVTINQLDGRMLKSNIEVECSWFCTGCTFAISSWAK